MLFSLLLLVGVAVSGEARAKKGETAAAATAAKRQDLQPFRAALLGSTMGLGHACILRDPPPHGAWTVIYEVTEPKQSGLAVGQQICEIVHSPSMHLRGLPSQDALTCRMVTGTAPPRFSCDDTLPSSGMAVFDAEYAERLSAEVQAKNGDVLTRLDTVKQQVSVDCDKVKKLFDILYNMINIGDENAVNNVLDAMSVDDLRAMCAAPAAPVPPPAP